MLEQRFPGIRERLSFKNNLVLVKNRRVSSFVGLSSPKEETKEKVTDATSSSSSSSSSTSSSSPSSSQFSRSECEGQSMPRRLRPLAGLGLFRQKRKPLSYNSCRAGRTDRTGRMGRTGSPMGLCLLPLSFLLQYKSLVFFFFPSSFFFFSGVSVFAAI